MQRDIEPEHAVLNELAAVAQGQKRAWKRQTKQPSAPDGEPHARSVDRKRQLECEGAEPLDTALLRGGRAEAGVKDLSAEFPPPDLCFAGSGFLDANGDVFACLRKTERQRDGAGQQARASDDRRAAGEGFDVLNLMQALVFGRERLPVRAKD